MELTKETTDEIIVRRLRPDDLERVIALDERAFGRPRSEYIKHKLELNLLESSVEVSLAAEVDGSLVGFLLARVYYGEFGIAEPVAVMDTLGVHPDFRRRGVGRALLDQLSTNLRGLEIFRLRTEVGWDDQDLQRFFHGEGFRPSERICLELAIDRAPPERAR